MENMDTISVLMDHTARWRKQVLECLNENNKRVKFYSITREGELFLENIQNHFNIILKNPSWMAFFEEMTGKRFNNEKRNRN